MEIQGQEKDMRGAGGGVSLSFAQLGVDSSTDDDTSRGRSDGNNHNNNCTQDYHHQQQRNASTGQIMHGSCSLKISSPRGIRYRECLRNHAASVGGNALDGCGEFMPSGEEGTLEALKCAACDCHRNFHRKEIDQGDHIIRTHGIVSSRRSSLMVTPLQLTPPPLPPPQTMLHHHHNYSMVTPMSVAFGCSTGGGGGTDHSSSEELNVLHSNDAYLASHSQPPPPFSSVSKKRFRTKFTQEQKEKMMEFAEELGWKFLRQDDDKIERFCAETGIKRQVFKVWMHNNKNSTKKHQQQPQQEPQPLE